MNHFDELLNELKQQKRRSSSHAFPMTPLWKSEWPWLGQDIRENDSYE